MNTRFWMIIFSIFYAVGFAGFQFMPDTMLRMTPWTLLAGGIIVLYASGALRSARTITVMLLAIIVTFWIEAIGVHTGKIFGPYHYGAVLGPLWYDVPPIIGFNWCIIIYGLYVLFAGWRIPSSVHALLAGALAVGFDYFLEPSAIAYGFWVWHGGEIPLQNYLAWFVITFIFVYLFRKLRTPAASRLVPGYVLIQFLFFALLLAARTIRP